MQAATAPDPERSRLIDHFKRAYQIIVGLSITLACTKLFPDGEPRNPLFDTTFWLFCTFFITVVPIFHGGDRSLDVKYLRTQPQGLAKVAYVWDVYMLLITAILFVQIAQSIPRSLPVAAGTDAGLIPSPSSSPARFYQWMMIMLIADLVILFIDGLKSRLLHTYWPWLVLNALFAAVCYWASTSSEPAYALTVSIIVFACALARTVADYAFGRDFMFP